MSVFQYSTLTETALLCPDLHCLGIYFEFFAHELDSEDPNSDNSGDISTGTPQHIKLEQLDLLDTEFLSNRKGLERLFGMIFTNARITQDASESLATIDECS